MNLLFSILSVLYIAGIFLLADSPMVSDIATFNPYSLLHIPLYGILTLLLILSFSPQRKRFVNPTNSTNLSREMRPAPCSAETTTSGSLFHRDPSNSTNLFVAGIIAVIVAIADEIHQAYLPNRNASVIDVLLDFVGIGLCIVVIRRIRRKPGLLKGLSIFSE